MRKRNKRNARNAVYVESGGWMGKGLIAAAVAAVLTVSLGYWLFVSSSESSLKKNCLTRLSVMVDRFDQLSEAWKNRGLHDVNDSRKKKNVVTEQHRGLDTNPQTNTKSPALNPSETPAAENSSPPETQNTPATAKHDKPKTDDVSQEDKAELKKLLTRETEQKPETRPKSIVVEHRTAPAPPPRRERPLRIERPRAEPTPEVPKEDQDALRDLLKNLD